jgi:hypothetical protein
MHPFSTLTLGIFVAGYITARWDLVTRLYELGVFAWDYGVVVSRGTLGIPSFLRKNVADAAKILRDKLGIWLTCELCILAVVTSR